LAFNIFNSFNLSTFQPFNFSSLFFFHIRETHPFPIAIGTLQGGEPDQFTFCLLPFVFCLLSFIFCLLSFIFCLLSFVFCLLSFVLIKPVPRFLQLLNTFERFWRSQVFIKVVIYFHSYLFGFHIIHSVEGVPAGHVIEYFV